MSASASAPAARTDADIVPQNPASGEIAGRVPDMTAEVPALVRRARSAQAAWGARPVEERAEVLAAMRRWIVANRTAIVESTMRETGKTYEDALFNEVFVLADAIRSGSARRRAICATNASAGAAQPPPARQYLRWRGRRRCDDVPTQLEVVERHVAESRRRRNGAMDRASGWRGSV